MQQNISSSLDKLFKCICRVLFGPFRKYNGLCTSELPLAKFQCFKTQDFGIHICSLRTFSAVYPQYLTNSSVQSLLTKPFSANLSSLRAFNIFPKLWQTFCCYHQKIQNNSWNIATRQMTPFFSYIPSALSIGMFHFKAWKIQFHGVPPLH